MQRRYSQDGMLANCTYPASLAYWLTWPRKYLAIPKHPSLHPRASTLSFLGRDRVVKGPRIDTHLLV